MIGNYCANFPTAHGRQRFDRNGAKPSAIAGVFRFSGSVYQQEISRRAIHPVGPELINLMRRLIEDATGVLHEAKLFPSAETGNTVKTMTGFQHESCVTDGEQKRPLEQCVSPQVDCAVKLQHRRQPPLGVKTLAVDVLNLNARDVLLSNTLLRERKLIAHSAG